MMQDEYTITGQVREVEELVILLCDELPIGGIGQSREEAFADLLNAFRLYNDARRTIESLMPEQTEISSTLHESDSIAYFAYSMNRGGQRHVVAP